MVNGDYLSHSDGSRNPWNSFLFCLYNFLLFTGNKVRPTDIILNKLVLTDPLVLLSRGTLIQKQPLDENSSWMELDINFYFQRVAKGVFFSTISLLGGFQATGLCPNFSKWNGAPRVHWFLLFPLPHRVSLGENLCSYQNEWSHAQQKTLVWK